MSEQGTPAAATPPTDASAASEQPGSAPPALSAPALQRDSSMSRHAVGGEVPTEVTSSSEEGSGSAAAAAAATAVDAVSAGSAASVADPRPCEEITIAGKRSSVVTDAEIDLMLFDGTNKPTGDEQEGAAEAALPARIASLRVHMNTSALLPASIYKLRELTDLSLHTCAMELVENEGTGTMIAAAHTEGDDPSSALSVPQHPSALPRGDSGLRSLRSLRTLELVHTVPPALTSAHLPSSLFKLSIDSYELSERNFFTHQLEHLKSLSLLRIRSLKQLPDSISVLQSLEQLTISHCPNLTALPSSLLDLPALTEINVSRNGLFLLPEGLDKLAALRSIDVQHNRLLVLPRVFATLKQRGCNVLYDEQLHEQGEQTDEEVPRISSVVVEEINETEAGDEAETEQTQAASSADALASASSPVAAAVAAAAAVPSPRSAASAAAASSPASSTTPPTSASSKPKRKLERDLSAEAADDVGHAPKHARADSQTAALTSEHDAAESAAASAATAAAASEPAAAVPAPRTKPGFKRRLDDVSASTALDHKRHKDDPASAASFKYFTTGELGYSDHIRSGFVDPGRHSKLFATATSAADMSVERALAQPVSLVERETVLVDLERDVRLRQIQRQARLMFKQQGGQAEGQISSDALQLQVKLLACLVSDSFGGRVVVFSAQQAALGHDSGSELDMLAPAAAAAAGSSAASPAAAAAAATAVSPAMPSNHSLPPSFLSPLSSLYALCHAETSWWRRSSGSNCVLLASVQHGLCRHRSLLMKLLCDDLFAPADVQCKLVRGFREGGIGHAWNVVRIRGGSEWIVDCLDSPMLLRPLSSLADPAFAYFSQYADASSSAFASATADASTQQTLATYRDLHLAIRGRLLGEGAYSQVFECRLPSEAGTSQMLALKVSQIGHLTPAHLGSLLKEVRLLPHLQHPNIVRFYAYLITPSALQIYMELVRGANLDVVLKTLRSMGQRLSVEDILVIAHEVAKGMRYLHDHATLHRDLKSAQVLIGHPALTDEGTSKPFVMPVNIRTHTERNIIKAKRKHTEAGTAAAQAASSAAAASGSSLLPAPLPFHLSFFSSASVKLCDFNIACAVLEPSSESDADAPHAPVLEYVGTLRWAAPEVFRASLQAAHRHTAAGTSRAAAGSAAASAASVLGASASAAQRLSAGRMADVWSYCCVLLELLTLHLPYEDVPTEADLNEMLCRGERSSYRQWLDEAYWPGVLALDEAEVESEASTAWAHFTSADADTHTDSSPSSSSRLVAYQALVGLFLQGTSSVSEQRPDMHTVCTALEHMHALLMLQAEQGRDALAEVEATAPAKVATPPSVAAPSAATLKHARARSPSPPTGTANAPRASRARLAHGGASGAVSTAAAAEAH